MLEELDPKVDPFSEENILVFASGPFQGTGLAGVARFLVMGKSPKTKNLNDSFCGGAFGHVLGRTGYDGIIIKGKAKKPVYISVDNGRVQILSAEDLWGLDPKEVEEKIAEVQKGASIACIGKAGENQGMQSSIIVDKTRSVGRPAYGAIMGLKKLKAVVVSGNQKKELANAEKFNTLRKEFAKKVANSEFSKSLKQFGTAAGVEFLSDNGMLPTKNFINGQFAAARKISGQTLVKDKVWVKNESCPGCPVACKRVVQGSYNGELFGAEWGGSRV